LADERGWLATIHMKEGVRADAREAVSALRALGVQTWLLSGDRSAAAQQVGDAVGVDHVIAGASPEQKLTEVIALQGRGSRLAMVGDGLNDGPVLARADTSFALGHAAPLAQAQSDYVIQGCGQRVTTPCVCPWRCWATCRPGWPGWAWRAARCW
jgi:Cu2+-exporting ATPase